MRCLNIYLFSNWNIVFVVIGLYKEVTVTNGLKYIHVPQWHNVISTEPKAPNIQKSQSRKFPFQFFDTYRTWISTQTFFHQRIQYQVSCCFIEYQSKVEKRSGKCNKNKLDSYIQKEDPNLVIYYYDPNFSISTSIWLSNSITFCQDYFSV